MATSKKKKVPAKKKVTKARAPRTAPVPKPKGAFLISLTFNETTFSARGTSAVEAFKNLIVPPTMVKTKVILRLQHKKLSTEQVIFGVQLRRILNSRTAKEIWAKRVEARLK